MLDGTLKQIHFISVCEFNFLPRRKKITKGPDLNINQIPSEIPTTLIKRMVLSQVNGIYDPLGLATPFTAKAKILLRKLCGTNIKSLDWDEPIPGKFRKEWIDFFRQLFQMEDITFQRCIKPEEAIGDPVLMEQVVQVTWVERQ